MDVKRELLPFESHLRTGEYEYGEMPRNLGLSNQLGAQETMVFFKTEKEKKRRRRRRTAVVTELLPTPVADNRAARADVKKGKVERDTTTPIPARRETASSFYYDPRTVNDPGDNSGTNTGRGELS